MVVPLAAAAAHAAGAAGTAVGLGMGKSDMDLTRDLFKLQMQQAKRLWTAEWAEASVRHGEACMQSAAQHAESMALATAAFYQTEKIASQSIKLARDQDSRSYEMAWRAEVREALRDELANQHNRFNILMLCDTVCLGCVFSLVSNNGPPTETPLVLLNAYVLSVGLSITLFTISLWCCVIVVRRLYEHTASTLERKLFAQSEDLQRVWRQHQHLPTGPQELYLVNQAYEKWVTEFVDPLGRWSIDFLSMGVVLMFITAGLLVHNQYLIEYKASSAVYIFWSTVLVTSTTVLLLKFREDRQEKMKLGVYDGSWQDETSFETGPFAKINRAAQELFNARAVDLASASRMEFFHQRERQQLEYCHPTSDLHVRAQALHEESQQRDKMRQDILQLLTTAAEELDALPEELTSQLNQVLHSIDEADRRTAEHLMVASSSLAANTNDNRTLHPQPAVIGATGRARNNNRRSTLQPMAPHPIDAQRILVSLTSVRKKLGEIPLTTLIRLRNLSDEPLRLKSGVQLKDGKYIKSLHAYDPQRNNVCYHLYPGTEIPPRTELVVAARSGGGTWVPTSGIRGTLMYTNRDQSWLFKIFFRNELLTSTRKCLVKAYRADNTNSNYISTRNNNGKAWETEGYATDKELSDSDYEESEYWQISKDILDRKPNNEVVISIDVLRGEKATKAAANENRQSTLNNNNNYKAGFLLKQRSYGLGFQWGQKWVEVTPKELIFDDMDNKKRTRISLQDITHVSKGNDVIKQNVFYVHTRVTGSAPYKLAAATPQERDEWISKMTKAIAAVDSTSGTASANAGAPVVATSASSNTTAGTSVVQGNDEDEDDDDGIECIQNEFGTHVVPSVQSNQNPSPW